MTDFKPGDRVHVEFEATVRGKAPSGRVRVEDQSGAVGVVPADLLTKIEPRPEDDPVGTVRILRGGERVVKIAPDSWVLMDGARREQGIWVMRDDSPELTTSRRAE